jgi:hypothetical protein
MKPKRKKLNEDPTGNIESQNGENADDYMKGAN